MKDKNSLFSKVQKRIYLPVILLSAGVLLILISWIADKDNTKDTQIYPDTYETDYANFLENKLKNTLESIDGIGKVTVMITFESTYEPYEQDDLYNASDFSLSVMSDNEKDTAAKVPTPKIGGVMIVCSTLSNPEDIMTIKKAAATALNIKDNKIYIIGGASQQ